MFVDSHAHLDDKRFADDLDDALDRARAAKVTRIVTVGDGVEGARAAVALAASRPDRLRAVVGLHPHSARLMTVSLLKELKRLAASPGVVALGEAGLDYYYDFSPRDAQREAFRLQIEAALELDLPLVVHCRDAYPECAALLEPFIASGLRGIVHCFNGTWEDAHVFLKFGLYIGLSGMITFRNAEALRHTVRRVPLDRVLIETDCPYLSPEGQRGRRNEPAFVPLVAETLAAIHAVPLEGIAAATTANAEKIYRLTPCAAIG